MQHKMYVCGQIIVPVCFPVYSSTKEQALNRVSEVLNSRTISVFDGDIHTWDGNSHPIIARRCRVIWTDVTNYKEEII